MSFIIFIFSVFISRPTLFAASSNTLAALAVSASKSPINLSCQQNREIVFYSDLLINHLHCLVVSLPLFLEQDWKMPVTGHLPMSTKLPQWTFLTLNFVFSLYILYLTFIFLLVLLTFWENRTRTRCGLYSLCGYYHKPF